jgi:flagellar hook-associated protein 3 FlgL
VIAMRVSTQLIFGQGSSAISRQQSEWLRTQQQLSSGRRMLTPSDDPIGAAKALRAEQARARAEQHMVNQASARSSLALAESVLSEAGSALQDARTLLVQANSGVLSDADRASLVIELRNRFDQLLGLANSRDANGEFLFSGYQGATQPFVSTVAGASYQGDTGERMLEVAEGRTLAISASGARIFDRVPSGNGRIAVSAAPGNGGSAIHDGGAIADPAALTGQRYRVQFTVAGASTTYDVLNLTTATTIVSGASYASGAAIQFDGLQLTLSGSPANGDAFELAPSAAKSVFQSLRETIARLETPVFGPAGRAALANGLVSGIQALDQAAERALEARARMGTSLRELDSLDTLVSGVRLQHEGELARLTDLDYAEAASRFAAQQTALEAAQRSYQRVTSLSLFDFI